MLNVSLRSWFLPRLRNFLLSLHRRSLLRRRLHRKEIKRNTNEERVPTCINWGKKNKREPHPSPREKASTFKSQVNLATPPFITKSPSLPKKNIAKKLMAMEKGIKNRPKPGYSFLLQEAWLHILPRSCLSQSTPYPQWHWSAIGSPSSDIKM